MDEGIGMDEEITSKANKVPPPCGLMIELEKDTLGSRTQGDNYVLGYFDRLYIRPVAHWLNFSPRNSAPCSRGDSWPLSSCPIRLLFPETAALNNLEKLGMDYGSWRPEDADAEGRSPALTKLFEDFPCFTVVLVNLTDDFKGEPPRDVCAAQLEKLVEVIRAGAAGAEPPYTMEGLRAAHFCILPSLGYSDYCILTAEKEWDLILPLMEHLHRAVDDAGNAVLSTDYIMPVYHAGTADSLNLGKDVHISVRINLRPGVSMQQLRDRLSQEDVEVYQITGSADCLLTARTEAGTRKVIELLEIGAKGRGKSGGVMDVVIDTESRLRRVVGQGSSRTKAMPSSDFLKKEVDTLRATLGRYDQQLTAGRRHKRQLSALREKLTLIENICGACHNRSLQLVMREWLLAFNSCMDRCIKIIEKRKNALDRVDAEHSPAEGEVAVSERRRAEAAMQLIWEMTEDALQGFIDQVGSFMADLSRSDCFFMESERYNHTSVCSATSLLIAYNHWQNHFVRDVLAEDEGKACAYPFLVRSGGCDSTHTQNLFHFLLPKSTPGGTGLQEDLPLISHMSEMGLFDCSGAVFRMTHECMHFTGRRLRQERVGYVIEFIAQCYGRDLANTLLSRRVYLDQWTKRVIEETEAKDSDSIRKEMDNAWKEALESLREKIAGLIRSELEKDLERENEAWNETDYLSQNVRERLCRWLARLFTGYVFLRDGLKASEFVYALCDAQLETLVWLYKKYDAVARGEQKTYRTLDFEAQRFENRLKDNRTDEAQKVVVTHMLGQLLGDPRYAVPKEDPTSTLRRASVENVVNHVAFDCFVESFADMQACLRLGAQVSDYLLGFVYERWDTQIALPVVAQFIRRIPAVLRVCFPERLTADSQALTKEAAEEIEEALARQVQNGAVPGRVDGKDIVRRVNEMLSEYSTLRGEREALEGYLQLCRKDYESRDHQRMKRYRDAFRDLHFSKEAGGDAVVRLFTSLTLIGGVSRE